MEERQWNLVGYARVSTDDQNPELQIDALMRHGVAEDAIYVEYISGAAKRRPIFESCLKSLREGDVLVIWKLDRLSRSLAELIKLSTMLDERGVQLRSLTESIDTTTAFGRAFFHFMGLIAQLERDLISERTKAGIEAARARGAVPGRRPTISPEQWAYAVDRVSGEGHVATAELLRDPNLMGIKASTMYAYRGHWDSGLPYPPEWRKYGEADSQD